MAQLGLKSDHPSGACKIVSYSSQLMYVGLAMYISHAFFGGEGFSNQVGHTSRSQTFPLGCENLHMRMYTSFECAHV
jgi:hypothetical protein